MKFSVATYIHTEKSTSSPFMLSPDAVTHTENFTL